MRAIDLYSGVGGWSLGLQMAGIEVVSSYEWWAPANRTNEVNNGHNTNEVDIRSLSLDSLPTDIQVVVGSPPCTQFSFSNRGGQGDLEDGLKDIYKFFEVVAYLKPKYWAMENVPRVANILEREFAKGGRLHRFQKALRPEIHVVHMEEFGVPQRRARCIAGNFDFHRLFSYRERCEQRTLGDVMRALSAAKPVDPIYGKRALPSGLIDHVLEPPLDLEEERMNREAKTHHPVYNNMPFPDPLNRPVRTITALCTRVSRESVVVADDRHAASYRRLSIRERASLQTFPIDFQFYGASYATKLKLIGNAVPPLMTFYIAQAMCEVAADKLSPPGAAATVFKGPKLTPPDTPPDKLSAKYSADRRFRFAIPGLRFKSGMRFELANDFESGNVAWRVAFYYGNSKNIHELPLDASVLQSLRRARELAPVKDELVQILNELKRRFQEIDPLQLQEVWTRNSNNGPHPFSLVDDLRDVACAVIAKFEPYSLDGVLQRVLLPTDDPIGLKKLLLNANAIVAGALVGAVANEALARPKIRKAA